MSNLSRAVSRALRHEPWLYELELDEEGWAGVGALLMALRQDCSGWSRLAETDLAEMIHKSSKQRYEMTNGGIRALYGHSLPGRLQKVPGMPPAHLFHGTAPASESRIRESGLLPMGRRSKTPSCHDETVGGPPCNKLQIGSKHSACPSTSTACKCLDNLRAVALRLYKKPASVCADTPNAARLFVPSPAVSFFGGFRTAGPSAWHGP